MQQSRPAIDTDILTDRLQAMLRAGRSAAARPLLQALQRLQPPTPKLSELEARLLQAEGRCPEALQALDLAIAAAPSHAGLRKSRAGVRVELGDLAAAADDAAQAIILDPADAGAKKMLGVLLVTLGRTPDAVACLREAVADDPQHASHYRGLAMAQDRNGSPDAAAATLAMGIAACPSDVSLRDAAILLALRQRDFAGAVELAETARREGCISATGFALLGHALASLGRHDHATEAYGEAMKLAPEDPQIRQLVATASLHHDGERAPLAQIRTIFDFYAEHFETHAISLGYRIPGVIRGVLREHLATPPAVPPPTLDLGCGTGLMAVAVGDLVGPITGIDISPAMLGSARAKALYAELIEADLLDWLALETRQWPIIIAADVLIYFGALERVFALMHARLAPGGLFLFSLEEHLPVTDPAHANGTPPTDPGWQLGRMGRFGHSSAYIARALEAAGLAVCRIQPEVQRQEAGAGVPGWLVVARRPA